MMECDASLLSFKPASPNYNVITRPSVSYNQQRRTMAAGGRGAAARMRAPQNHYKILKIDASVRNPVYFSRLRFCNIFSIHSLLLNIYMTLIKTWIDRRV